MAIYRVRFRCDPKDEEGFPIEYRAWEELHEMGLKAPNKRWKRQGRFWFTEAGWSEYGREWTAITEKLGLCPIVKKRKEPKDSDVSYRDEWQVVLLPIEKGGK